MGMTDVETSKINYDTGIKIGSDKAPVKVVEYINVRCPFCRQWSDEKNDLLQQLVAEGKIQRVIKLFDKEKPSLALGNIMHHHIPTDEKAIAAIQAIYETQDDWGNLDSHEEVALYATEKLQLTLQDYKETAESIVQETIDANVFFVPTVIIGEHVVDQKISNDELLALINE
ncbi:thioredoxin domain-containing protein [Vagococcus carniphilus]|uniref:thioredoxin domain-containing protein n=1 Tax=Vagococcus carniphilus TaxID=218144 RepID=UPI00288D9606|nr:thioredoxin domain-containing protein [Vagococcus carniphilus]MDT2815375.1 thioredoxin domain-containing protein [Vagococcus carniphilus]